MFKMFLVGYLLAVVITCLCDMSKGKYTIEKTPIKNAIAAIMGILLVIGTVLWL